MTRNKQQGLACKFNLNPQAIDFNERTHKENLGLPKKIDILKGLNSHIETLKSESTIRSLVTHIVQGNQI
jgi:hypothetical protein